MKNQNDLIVSIASVVLALGFIAGFIFMNPRPITLPPKPEPVPTGALNLPAGSVSYANTLPGASAGGAGGAGGASPFGPGMGNMGAPGGLGGPGGRPPGMPSYIGGGGPSRAGRG